MGKMALLWNIAFLMFPPLAMKLSWSLFRVSSVLVSIETVLRLGGTFNSSLVMLQ
jgi:hypothetical protein